jgi:ligand-binding sensor domain-containing protein
MQFDHATLDDGLSQSAVISILQDSRGLMWFGTENGLNRFDGYTFEHFKRERGNPNALRSDFIYDIADADNGLWLATNGGGFAFLDNETGNFTTYRNDAANPDSIAGNVVRRLELAEDGTIWLGLRDAGLDRFNPKDGTFSHYDLGTDQPASVFALTEDSAGAIWVGTESGLFRLAPDDGAVERFTHDAGDSTSISGDRIRSIYEDTAGNIWVGTRGAGLNRYNHKNGSFEHFRHDASDTSSIGSDRITAILEDDANRLWIGTAEGLSLLQKTTGQFVRYQNNPRDVASLADNRVAALYQDRSGILWVGVRGCRVPAKRYGIRLRQSRQCLDWHIWRRSDPAKPRDRRIVTLHS